MDDINFLADTFIVYLAGRVPIVDVVTSTDGPEEFITNQVHLSHITMEFYNFKICFIQQN